MCACVQYVGVLCVACVGGCVVFVGVCDLYPYVCFLFCSQYTIKKQTYKGHSILGDVVVRGVMHDQPRLL